MVDVPLGDEISYGGKIFRINGTVRVDNITVPPNPVVFGDTDKTGVTQVLTQFTQSSNLGGSGKYRANTRTDSSRCWASGAETAYLDVLTLPPEVVLVGKPSGVTADCDLIVAYRGVIYAVFGDIMYSVGSDLSTFTNVMGGILTTFAAVPTDAIVYKDKLYVANGTQIDVFDSVLTHTSNAQNAKFFEVWDNKLWAMTLESDGWTIYQSTDGGTWTASTAKIPVGSTVTDFLLFRDTQGSSVLAALTNGDLTDHGALWLYDANTPKWYESEVTWSPMSADQEAKGQLWRDGKLYVNIGNLSMVGIQPGNPFVITPMGLDQDDGVPSDEVGRITSLVQETNWVIAKIDGTIPNEYEAEWLGSDPWEWEYWPNYAGTSTIRRWFGGWHQMYKYTGSGATGKGMCLSSALNGRRLWFSMPDGLRYIELDDSTYNPRMNPTRRYQLGPLIHQTPWWPYGTEGQDKLHGRIYVDAFDMEEDVNSISVFYHTDLNEGGGILVATIETNGLHEIVIDPQGIQANWFQYHFAFLTLDPTKAPKMRYYRTDTMRLLPATYGYGMQIDLTKPCRGRTPYQQLLELKDLANPGVTPLLQPFWYRDDDGTEKLLYARITQLAGNEHAGVKRRGEGTWLMSVVAPYLVYDEASLQNSTVHNA